jgi:hypothetical protein
MNAEDDFTKCLDAIVFAKEHLDSHIAMYRSELMRKLIALFSPSYRGSLTAAVMNWYNNLPVAAKQHLFDTDTNALLVAISQHVGYDDNKMLDELVHAVAVIAIEDWNDRQADIFFNNISESIAKVNGFTAKPVSGDQGGKLSVSMEGTHIEKVFSADAITPLGKTMLNNLRSIFEDYNNALEPEEQLAIMAKLIGEIIH